MPASGTHDPQVTTTPAPTTSAAAETSGSNVASTRGDPDASSTRDASRRRGRARDARTQIMRAVTTRPRGVTLGVATALSMFYLTFSHKFFNKKLIFFVWMAARNIYLIITIYCDFYGFTALPAFVFGLLCAAFRGHLSQPLSDLLSVLPKKLSFSYRAGRI